MSRPGRESEAALGEEGQNPEEQPTAAVQPTEFAILRRQTEQELVISEVHAQLDRVLAFLEQAVGYPLLDDARPIFGGAVAVTTRRLKGGGREDRLARLPSQELEDPDEEEVGRQVLRFSRGTARYARYPDDLVLVWRLAERLVEGNAQAGAVVRTEKFYKTVLKGVRLMHLCEFSYSDIVVTLAYSTVYFIEAFAECGDRMSDDEAAHVCLLLIYLAQVFVLDEICPLKCWQSHVFRNYCSVQILNAALFRLFHLRQYKLRISEYDERQALAALLSTPEQIEVVLGSEEAYPAVVAQSPTPKRAPAEATPRAAESPEIKTPVRTESVKAPDGKAAPIKNGAVAYPDPLKAPTTNSVAHIEAVIEPIWDKREVAAYSNVNLQNDCAAMVTVGQTPATVA